MSYGISTLPEVTTQAKGRPVFRDRSLSGFSISYVGNIVGVALTTGGTCGPDIGLQRIIRGLHNPNSMETRCLSSNGNLWINNRNDPNEARVQPITSYQSVLKLTGDVCNDDLRELQLSPGAGCPRCAHVVQVEAICDTEDVLV